MDSETCFRLRLRRLWPNPSKSHPNKSCYELKVVLPRRHPCQFRRAPKRSAGVTFLDRRSRVLSRAEMRMVTTLSSA